MSLAIPVLLAAKAACEPVKLSDWHNLLAVIWDFLSLSLFSLGGGNTLLAEYHSIAVHKYCWITSNQFADIYALAEAAPGPSSMIVGLLGMGAAWREGPLWALLSGIAAEAAILLPSTLVMVVASLSWSRFKDSPWRVAFERGMGPITADHSPLAYGVSVVVCFLMLRTKISPLWFMGLAGVMGGLGWISRF